MKHCTLNTAPPFDATACRSPMKSSRRLALTMLAGLALPSLALAQAKYPSKPIRVVLPFPAGTSPDVIVRLWADRLSKADEQPVVVVENKPGAVTIIGAQAVATAPADGYTLLYTVNNTLSINPFIYDKLPYKADDFVPVVRLVTVPYLLLVPADSPFKTVKDLVAGAKARPGKLTYGSFGVGQGTHVAMARLVNEADVQIVHVPYNAPQVDLIAGRIDALIDAPTTALPLLKAGKIRALAVMGTKRLDTLPDVPTVAETYPGFVVESWHGILAPKGTPPEVIATLSRLTLRIIATDEFRAKIHEYGLVTADPNTPEDFRKYLVEDARIWSKVVRDNNIKVQQ